MKMMSRLTKLALVFGGYAAACLIAYGAIYVHQLLSPPDVLQASAGMSAFGEFVLFIIVFGFFALVPAGLAAFLVIRKIMKQQPPIQGTARRRSASPHSSIHSSQ